MIQSSNQHIYHQGDDKFAIASMRKYLDNKQEMDKLLDTLISSYIKDKKLQILDAGCGVGHSLYFLNQLSPNSNYFGVDQTAIYIDEAKKLFADMKNFSFEVGNVEDLPNKYPKAFDVSISRAVISWLPYYEDFVKALMDITRKHIFISSLFYDGDIDFITKVKSFKGASGKENASIEYFYNVYSLPKFKRFVMGLGAKNIEVTDFEINIDLTKLDADQMGTYTEKLENGKRLQISGAILMNWKWIRIDF